MSLPISARITCAVCSLTPGTLAHSSTRRRYGLAAARIDRRCCVQRANVARTSCARHPVFRTRRPRLGFRRRPTPSLPRLKARRRQRGAYTATRLERNACSCGDVRRAVVALRPRRERPLRRPAGQPRPPRRSVEHSARGLPSARVGPDRLVEPGSAVQEAGLAARTSRLRRVAADGVDPGGDVPAGVRGHGRRGGVPDGHDHVYIKDVAADQPSMSRSEMGPILLIPALLTSTSSRPNSATARSTSPTRSSRRVTSVSQVTTAPPRAYQPDTTIVSNDRHRPHQASQKESRPALTGAALTYSGTVGGCRGPGSAPPPDAQHRNLFHG